MTVSSFIDFKQKYKPSPFRWHVVELFRLGLVSEGQILAELNISRTSLRVWNRAYHRYRLLDLLHLTGDFFKADLERKLQSDYDQTTSVR